MITFFPKKSISSFVKLGLSTFLITNDWVKMALDFFCDCQKNSHLEQDSVETLISNYHDTWTNTATRLASSLSVELEEAYHGGIEFTPFTFFLATISDVDLVKTLKLTSKDQQYLEELYTIYYHRYLHNTKVEVDGNHINIMMHVAIVPPLQMLERILSKAYNLHKELAQSVYAIVNVMPPIFPEYRLNFGLHCAAKYLPLTSYMNAGGLEGLLNNEALQPLWSQFRNISDKLPDQKHLDQVGICPCCGEEMPIVVQKDHIFHAHLQLLHPELAVAVAFQFYEDYISGIYQHLIKACEDDPLKVLGIRNTKCIILVEGKTESNAIPRMALKYGKPLSTKRIHVWDAKSKQRVVADFLKIRENWPDMKICILLDSDAVKEKEDLERMITGHRDQYCLRFISIGAFENLIPIPVAIQAFRTIYPDVQIEESWIDASSDRSKELDRILREACAGSLDKVVFIERACSLLPAEDISPLIKELIDDAYKLAGV